MTSTTRLTALAFATAVPLLGIAQQVLAHGYVTSPTSRNYACKLGDNTNCGAIIWEPQSLEAPKGFPQSGPADGKIASAGLAQFSPLDAQSANRWSKQSMRPGQNTFSWTFTANHSTSNWRYFITKPGWNVNAALSRQSFDLQPFCSVSGNQQQPPKQVNHNCNVPDRNGYHVILAVWDIGDTTNAFYNVIDVNLAGNGGGGDNGGGDGGGEPGVSWLDVGDINPLMSLAVGDLVRARVFDGQGENTGQEVRLPINSMAEGGQFAWPAALAQKINAESDVIRAGRLRADGSFEIANGKNEIYAPADSSIRRVEITIDKADDGGGDGGDGGNGGGNGGGDNGGSGHYDHVYPDGISGYTAGTKVLGSDGDVYTCKPFPYSGWCTIKAHQYTPGTGSHWQDAWFK
ncbi:MAG: chitin-binding protein [unclassified Hahellaceae]|nr:chitin-binding protein [Hahellaceae bacterium]|tara:strand:+ start:15388 stop:16596 length:1209 start_codon:yes stop_codon:yes gene_type:complete